MIRILHAADLHLDSPFAAMSPSQAALRRREQRQVLVRLVEACNSRDCQLLLLAGDLFDSDRIYRETAELLCRLLRDCRARVFIAPGNHDPYGPLSVYSTVDWPENVHIFRSERIEAVTLADPAVTVYGAAFTGSNAPALLRGFRAQGRPAVMVIHGVLTDGDSPYNPISTADAAGSGLDYLALGHVHEDSLQQAGTVTVGVPGCAMGRGFDELGEKGAYYVELDEAGCRVQPVPLGARQYQVCSVRVEGDPLEAVLKALPADTEADIYRILLKGTCPTPDLRALREALAPRFWSLELVDRTVPPTELWAAAAEDSLKGAFLRELKPIYEQAEGTDRQTVALAARIGLALMEGREVPEA